MMIFDLDFILEEFNGSLRHLASIVISIRAYSERSDNGQSARDPFAEGALGGPLRISVTA